MQGGCLEFYEGLCGWVNTNLKVPPWSQALHQEMESSLHMVDSYLRKKEWTLMPGKLKKKSRILFLIDVYIFTLTRENQSGNLHVK